mgnify:CR=1 FL=1|jgi:hypothetical protein
MAIRLEVMENGKIELFDSENKSWSQHESVRHAMMAAARILRHEINSCIEEQLSSNKNGSVGKIMKSTKES